MNIGTDPGAMPAKVSDRVRARSIIGLAKLVDDDHQYAAVMYAPTAKGGRAARPDPPRARGPGAARRARTRAKSTTIKPKVPRTSESHRPPPDRSLPETVTAGR